jgi:integrase
MAAATVKNCLRMLKMVLADAVVDFELPRSPAERIRNFPMRRRLDEEANSLEADELGKVLACFRESEPEHYPLALTLALTGIRYGEATALKWSDVDEQDGLIRVARAQWKGHVSTTKTGVIRTVPLVPELATALREQRNRQLAEQSAGLAEGWIFTKSDGRLLPKSALRWPLIRVLERVGIKRRFTRHGFRFTFNNLSRRVAGEIVTRSITGHVTQAMTEHYSHVGREEKLRAAGSIVQLVMGKGTPTSSG